MSDIYHAYAPFYDGSGQIRFAVLFANYLLGDILPRHPVAGRRALDLACGTGTLALILVDAGWFVIGVDRSSAMIAIARSRAQSVDAAIRPQFIEADIRWLWQETMGVEQTEAAEALRRGAFDLVTCTYDSLNYMLTEEDLKACFSTAAEALAPGGLFVADMNTHYFLEHEWGEVEVIERPGFIQVSRSRFDPATACSTMRLIGFVGDDDSGYERFEEVHVERAYAPETVASLIAAAGLTVEAVYDCFTTQPIGERTQRIAWVARKR
ncbi:MAG: class I SAM-dependent methyltransferase [Roseiflexaceae bacterium]|nr:class I SAM-dependent methyltransferase [Roseiflexus sp.]MDW8145654.1 class I SAM-dependent methyltransferase [Roseiflexaceae bacterium]MDW8215424.1 class I SAM-dependent methyltransferase [Roseiflexaceae bacterium]